MSKKQKNQKAKKKAQRQAEAVQPKSAADLHAAATRERGAAEATKAMEGAGDGKVLVKNALDGVHVIGLPGKESGAGGVHNSLKLMPGVNSVDADLWEEAKKQKMVQIHLDEGNLVEFGKRGLAELGDRAALKLVKETVDRGLLEQWRDTEEREAVQEAIERQLAAIAPTPPKQEDADEDDGDEDDDAGGDDGPPEE